MTFPPADPSHIPSVLNLRLCPLPRSSGLLPSAQSPPTRPLSPGPSSLRLTSHPTIGTQPSQGNAPNLQLPTRVGVRKEVLGLGVSRWRWEVRAVSAGPSPERSGNPVGRSLSRTGVTQGSPWKHGGRRQLWKGKDPPTLGNWPAFPAPLPPFPPWGRDRVSGHIYVGRVGSPPGTVLRQGL